jgi:hypothetical protein
MSWFLGQDLWITIFQKPRLLFLCYLARSHFCYKMRTKSFSHLLYLLCTISCACIFFVHEYVYIYVYISYIVYSNRGFGNFLKKYERCRKYISRNQSLREKRLSIEQKP